MSKHMEFYIQDGAVSIQIQNGIRSTIDYPPSQCTHYKPRTIEDVLREFAQECAKSSLVYREADIEHYADELRSMGVGE